MLSIHALRERLRGPSALPALALVAATAAACGSPGATGTPTPAADDRIEMSRGPCFGACPMYTVTVWGDGRVRYDGRDHVKSRGVHEATVAPADVAELLAYAERAGFFSMPRDITPANEAACGGAWTDMPSADVTIDWGEREHTVNHYHGCPEAPEALMRLETRIDEVAGVARWVGSP